MLPKSTRLRPFLTLAAFVALSTAPLWSKPNGPRQATEARPVHRLFREESDKPARFAIALDEVALLRGKDTDFQRIPPQDSMGALRAWVEAQTPGADPESIRLVVYDQTAGGAEAARGYATRETVVALQPGVDPVAFAHRQGASCLGELAFAPGYYRYRFSSAIEALTVAERLARAPQVRSILPQVARLRIRDALPDDPLFVDQWHLKNTGQTGGPAGFDLNVEGAWESVRGRGITIGIVDDSLLATHPDLAANVNTALGYDFRDGDSDPSPDLVTPNQQDPQNKPHEDAHGTLVAGVAAGRGFNGIGGSGVAPEAQLAGIRLIGDYLTDLQEAQAISYRNDAIHIKNNSWGPNDNGAVLSGPDELAQAALADAIKSGRGGRGTIFVWSAGNGGLVHDNANKAGYANSIYTIAVGALDDRERRAEYSEIGANILISAPVGSRRKYGTLTTDLPGDDGLNIAGYKTDLDDPAYTQNFFGTSASAPMISGIAALMLEANPNLGWRDVMEILIRTARKIDTDGESWITNAAGFRFSDEYGAGLADASAAVSLAKTWTNLPAMQSTARSLELETPIDLPAQGNPVWAQTFDFSGVPLRVEQATVSVFVDHPFRGELAFELESPAGTISQLVAQSDDDSRGYLDWTFSSVQFWGESAAGQWKVRIVDGADGNAGQIWQATVTLHGTETSGNQIPATPSDLAVSGTRSNGVSVSWTDQAANETGYRVEFSVGWGNLWLLAAELPANSTRFELNLLPQNTPIYFRVAAVNASQKSGYSPTRYTYTADGQGAVLLEENFEPSDGFSANAGISGHGEWEPFPAAFTYPAQGVLSDQFSSKGASGHGQQAYVGYAWKGGQQVSSILHPIVHDPAPHTQIQFSTLLMVTPSTNGAWDGYGFDLFNQDGALLLSVLFDAYNEDILYSSPATDYGFLDSGKNFRLNKVLELTVTLDLASDQWSASLDGSAFVTNLKVRGSHPSVAANLGTFDAFWYVLNPSKASNGRMFFDEVKIQQVPTGAPGVPGDFAADAKGSSINFISWAEELLARNYELQRSPDGSTGWTTIATIAEDNAYYIDAFLETDTTYYYRMRAIGDIGNSQYTETASARTYTEYEAWKNRHRLEITANDADDSDGDGIPLLIEYAFEMSPQRESNRTPLQVGYQAGRLSLRYFRARSDLQYTVESSPDMVHWSTDGVTQQADTLGLYITADMEALSPDSRYLRVVVSEK